jgi:dienelactone hydrolase
MNTSASTPLPSTRRRLAALALLLSAAALPALAQRIEIDPGPDVLAGEPLGIAVSGLAPGAEVTLRATRLAREFTGGQRVYAADASFRADAQGRIALATQAPLAGSYSGADVRGLLWSMQPVPDAKPESAPAADHVRLELRAGTQGKPGPVLAEQTLHLLPSLPAVGKRAAEPFAGAVFATLPGAVRRPALILLGGSEGGSLITRDAPVWASRGFAVLALPYYSPPGWGPNGPTPAELPSLPAAFADIPLERLQAARDWLAAQPEVDAARIGVMGTSKGAEFALLAAARMPWIRSVVALVPSDVVWEGWGPGVASGQRASFSWQGKPLPFVPYLGFEEEFAGIAQGKAVHVRRPQDRGRAAHPERVAPARIAVEDIAAPVLVAGSHDDQIWDSGGMAQNIAASRARAGRETVLLVYADAGHFIGGTGLSPTTQYNAGPMKSGGTPAANARAQAEVFARTAEFLRRTLGPMPQ